MALSTYSELRSSLAGQVRADVVALVGDFITLAEDRMNRRLRIRAMESRVQASVSSEYVQLPTGFLAMRNFQLNTSPRTRLEYATPEYLDAKYGDSATTGQPVFYTLVGGEIQLAPVPDGTYTAEMDFYEKLDIATDLTNWVLTNAPRVYYYGALAEAQRYIKDDKRAAQYDALQEIAIQDLEKSDAKDKYPDFGLQMRSDIGAPV